MSLPVDAIVPDVINALRDTGVVIVVAPPGAGKTTRLPLLLRQLLAGPARGGSGGVKMIVTEPRRLATRSAAERMAESLGEPVGRTVGFRMRDETKVGARTEVEVVTEGVLLRMLTADQALEGVGMVILDEVHERHLDTDLALALLLDIRAVLRPELMLVVMSATLDDDRLSRLLNAPVVSCGDSPHKVDVHWEPALLADLPAKAATATLTALRSFDGDALVFAPGAAEIRAISRALDRSGLPPDVDVRILHGSAPVAEQRAAIAGSRPGRRSVVLSTSIAQTSLTVPGVRIVVDCGLQRSTQFDRDTGLTRMVTERCSQSTAIQRSGRAGRLGPGNSIRLWSSTEFQRSPPYDEPEILRVDLTALALRLTAMGIANPSSLEWLDPPTTLSWQVAVATLERLALAKSGVITDLGRRADRLAMDPPLAALLLMARSCGADRFFEASIACAVLDDPDVMRRTNRDEGLRDTIRAVMAERPGHASISNRAERFRRLVGVPEPMASGSLSSGAPTLATLVSRVFPERIAVRDDANASRYTLVSGVLATVDSAGPLAGERFLAVVDIDGDRREGSIWSALPLTISEVEADHAGAIQQIRTVTTVRADTLLIITATTATMLGRATLGITVALPTHEEISAEIVNVLTNHEFVRSVFATPEAEGLMARMNIARSVNSTLPDWSVAALVTNVSFVTAIGETFAYSAKLQASKAEVAITAPIVCACLLNTLAYRERDVLDELTPSKLLLPNGRWLALRYGFEDSPSEKREFVEIARVSAEARVQDLFGLQVGPTVGNGDVPVVLTLLTPAGRPTAVTADLAGFWQGGYRQVRAELRGRYPKHPWPEDPAAAIVKRPTNRRNSA